MWSRSDTVTQNRHRHAEHLLPEAGHGEPDPTIGVVTLDDHLGSLRGYDDRLGELGAQFDDVAGLSDVLIDKAGCQRHGEHAMGDHPG